LKVQLKWTPNIQCGGVQSSITLESKSRTFEIGKIVWHKASNPGTENAHVIEVQWGECYEEDIKRKD